MKISVKNRICLEIAISILLLVSYFIFNFFLEDMIEQTLALALDQTLFPKAITITVIIMCFLLVYDSVKRLSDFNKGIKSPIIEEYFECSEEKIPVGRILVYLTILFGYLFALDYFGFIYSTPVVMLLIAKLLGMKRYFLGAIGAIAFTLFMNWASLYCLQILLPTGTFFG